MQNDDITVFAETTFRNRKQRFGIKRDDRRRHMYFIGKTGMGKSTVMENMIVNDIRSGQGVAVVDPHGDLAEKTMKYIPSDRVKDIVYFNPSDTQYPIAFNVVEQVDPSVRHLVASGLVGVFKKLWADSWGPRLEYILRNAILAILDYPDCTLLGVIRMLSDKPFRKKIISNVQDPVVKAFWEKEFAGYADKFASEAVSPIQNKVGQFLSSSLIRNIVGQKKSAIDMRDIMDSGKILIMNLSKGHIGEDNSALLGAMMITKIQLAAMSRVNIPEQERKDFYLYIDEFQNFSTESFATILSEARKYRLNLIMAHQYIEQLSEDVASAVFGNVGTLICFRVGATDAEELVKEFAPTFMEEDILNIPKYEFYLKLMIDGVASEPFSARGLPPLTEEEVTGNFDKCIEYTRANYAKEKSLVEDDIMKTHFTDDNKQSGQGGKKKEQDKKASKSQGEPAGHPEKGDKKVQNTKNKDSGYEVKCSTCGSKTVVNFKPDGIRPVYCRDCRSEMKKKKRQDTESKNKKNDILSNLSPSELQERAAEEASAKEAVQERKKDDWISLDSLKKDKSLLFSDNKDRSENGEKKKQTENNDNRNKTGDDKEKDINEDEDIFFE